MSLSLVIPTRRVADIDACIKSMEGKFDELIIVDELWDNLAKKINYGVEKSTKEYVVIANDDITLVTGHLKDLCDDDVTSPAIQEGTLKPFHAHCWCVKRDTYWKVGGMDEGYDGFYYDDSDMWMRFLTNGFKVKINQQVIISHPHPATTLKTLPGGREIRNKERFIELWGQKGLDITQSR